MIVGRRIGRTCCLQGALDNILSQMAKSSFPTGVSPFWCDPAYRFLGTCVPPLSLSIPAFLLKQTHEK
uniref:Uncharacterized protein n=1 Tax=Nelumbo nucifera TaxID=4432 RepID=A0A822Y4D4_NELNU|nr:TPA_asm: hypothetical protein HUJ06_028868 [Nelumbo nucifera]